MKTLSIEFDIKIFQNYLKLNKDLEIETAISNAFEQTIYDAIKKECDINFTINNFCLYMNDKKSGYLGLSKSVLIKKGVYVDCITFEISFVKENHFCINEIFIKSKDFPISDIWGSNWKCFQKGKTTYYLQFGNIHLPKQWFSCLDLKTNCKCENVKFYNENFFYPLLYYCPECGKLYFCECQKPYYEIIYNDYKRKLSRSDIHTYDSGESCVNKFVDIYNKSSYKKGICFICNHSVPPPLWHYAETTAFGYRYYPYIKAKIDAYYNGSYLNDTCTEVKDNYKNYKKTCKDMENDIRQQVGYPLIGEKWINETTLYKICCSLFNEYTIIREYSPSWLNRMRLDIFIEELSLGIEYQGEQHFKNVEHFGGEEEFKKRQKRDKEKAKLCRANNINLVYFNFDEELTEETVLKKLKKYLKKLK